MRTSQKFVLSLAAVFFGLLLVPRAAVAQAHVANCPTEPQTGVPIASGNTFAGANCVLNTPGDIDGFTFSANAGNTYQFVLGYQGGFTNVCLTLLDPNSTIIIPQTCTNSNAIVLEKTLTTAGNAGQRHDRADRAECLHLQRLYYRHLPSDPNLHRRLYQRVCLLVFSRH